MSPDEGIRVDADFTSEGCRCAAWLYRPECVPAGTKLPIVVMAHGFAGQRRFRLPSYAKRFVDRGIAVLVFDYRHFGDSEGEPRNVVNHWRQQRDWRAAIEHAGTIEGIDATRIGLWGSSFSGGHVVALAGSDLGRDIRAISSHVPMLSMVRSLRIKPKTLLQAVGHGLWDCTKAIFGAAPHYVPVVAPPAKFAALNQEGCDEGYHSMVPESETWANQVAARSLVTSLLFDPGRKASNVQCPALFVIANHDQVIRTRVSTAIVKKVRNAEPVYVDADHFEVYQGEHFDRISTLQSDFFERCLR